MADGGRWAALFADLEAELAGVEARELDDEVRDRTAREHGRLALADRLAAQHGTEVTVTTNGAGVVRGRLADSAKDWLLVGDTLVPRTAVLAVAGLGPAARDPDAAPRTMLPIGWVLRGMAREREPVACTLVDGRTLRGRVERVGRDHVDVAGQAVPFRAIAALRPG